jgi:sucrose-phosphate synthase
MAMREAGDDLYILLITVHGLVRGHNLELGRDSDTGGQIKYVLELARALAVHPQVGRVDVLTRQVIDTKVDPDYGMEQEQIAEGAFIVRLPFGPKRYLRKEVLWPHLDSFTDQALKYVRRIGRLPDVIHAHYADAGYVGVHLAGLLEIPLIFTGHSLGHVKRQRLMEQGVKREAIENQYHISQRIEAEDQALYHASVVIASTHQEVDEQYSQYDNYQPQRMVVIPPGVDLQRFHPPRRGIFKPPIYRSVARFLEDPGKPMILALSRPDPRKNIATLVRAYGEHARLRELANLVVIAGNREELATMEKGPRRVLTEIMLLIDRHDLYGHIAYPKRHQPEDVPDLYRLAAKSYGVFVNPALTEPFGLTLLEAAASGLPVVATEDGGPRDIIGYCKNGVLIDPLDADRLGEILVDVLGNRRQWRRWSRAGIAGAQRHFTWQGHVNTYLKAIGKVIRRSKTRKGVSAPLSGRLPISDRILVCDIDNTLIGDADALKELMDVLRGHGGHVGFGVATGRHIESAQRILREWRVPTPDFIITSVGSELRYGAKLIEDVGWQRHIDYRWEPEALREALHDMPGLRLQSKEEQRQYKISYLIDPTKAPSVREILQHLRRLDLHAHVVYSHQMFIDVLPMRASKGAALRYFADKWGIPVERILVAGDSGNDEEMLSGETLGVVVGNHSEELERLRDREQIYFANGCHAWGIIEGINHYDFLGTVRVPLPD